MERNSGCDGGTDNERERQRQMEVKLGVGGICFFGEVGVYVDGVGVVGSEEKKRGSPCHPTIRKGWLWP